MVLLSTLFIVVGLVSMYLRGGLNYGIDFTGGTLVQVRFPQPTSIDDVRAALDRPELRGVRSCRRSGARGTTSRSALSEAESAGRRARRSERG